jgi:hypothetical protein
LAVAAAVLRERVMVTLAVPVAAVAEPPVLLALVQQVKVTLVEQVLITTQVAAAAVQLAADITATVMVLVLAETAYLSRN